MKIKLLLGKCVAIFRWD